ncbi:hypothetical protein [Croceicoccus mobilis]|uniref:PilZ domain-containing protein n=1 Tax=Croceicoccus mobilis TaxID=1703339 RepID=A0A916YWZ1_9SPHN|nr:hypothetical protein [Croceicoccus mobilis]GGD64845.1 hypothetical protein GCM10010990_12920 [Croceicoccus mobilis]
MIATEAERAPLRARCKYRIGTGMAFPAQLTSLSADEAQIEGISRQLRLRDRLTVSFGGLHGIDAEVDWIERGSSARLRFINPLYPAVHTFVMAKLRGANFEVRRHKPRPAIRACS